MTTTDRDLERTLDEWLVSGPTAVPDWVLRGAFERIEGAPGRPRPFRLTRSTPMQPSFRLVAAATLALVLGLGVVPLLTPATPLPSPSASPPPSASPAAPAAAVTLPAELQGTWIAPWREIDGLRNTDAYGVALRFMPGQVETTGGAAVGLKSRASLDARDQLRVETTLAATGCATGDTGVYTWSITGDAPGTLTITPVSDDCALRREVLTGTFRGTGDCALPNNTLCLGPLPAGDHASLAFEPRGALREPERWRPDGLTFTVPDGWEAPFENVDELYLTVPATMEGGDGPPEIMVQARPVALDTTRSLQPYTAPGASEPGCVSYGDPTVGRTVDDLVAFLVSHPGLDTTDPVDLTLGGRRAVQVDVDIAADWTGRCEGWTGSSAFVPIWGDARGFEGDGPASSWTWGPGAWEGQTHDPYRFILVDLGGEDVVLVTINSQRSNDPARHDVAGQAAFVERAMPIVESFAFRD